MEEAHWLSRNRASLDSAHNARSSEARLIHYDLAGRYSLKALAAGRQSIGLADALPAALAASLAETSREEPSDA